MNLFERLTAAIDPFNAVHTEDERFLDAKVTENVTGHLNQHRPAAVLIAVTDRPNPGIILTQRPEFLRVHPGQVAFPGGKIDDTDAGEIEAALREAHEELALSPHHVKIIGITDTYYSGSGYRISPVVGVIPPDLKLTANPHEVADWFEVPLNFLVDPANSIKKTAPWMGRERQYYDMEWQGRRIWGVTAGIIMNFARRLNGVSGF